MSDPVQLAERRQASRLRSVARAMWSFWLRGRPVERTGYAVGAVLFLLGLIHVAVLALGGGSWEGQLSFRKAAPFGLSFGLPVITIVWVASFLRLSDRRRAVLLGAFTVASVVETGFGAMQAWGGVPSLFNLETT